VLLIAPTWLLYGRPVGHSLSRPALTTRDASPDYDDTERDREHRAAYPSSDGEADQDRMMSVTQTIDASQLVGFVAAAAYLRLII
jgi:hypothetical protein